jgi:hypothetical protein
VREGQENPTARAGFKNWLTPRRPARTLVSGLRVDVRVLQHCNVPTLPVHELAGTGVRVGGGKLCLAIGVAEAATPLTAARPATKDTMGL